MNTTTIIKAIELNLNRHSNPVVSCSFGKDSLVILDMARQIYPEIPVIFNNTKVEFPDTLQLKRQLTEEWKLNLVEAKPLNGWTFWRVVEKYGFPVGQRRGVSATSKCCYHLKKAPMQKALREHGWDLVIDGLNIFESRQRFFLFSKYSDNYGYRFNKKWKCHKLSPILTWTPSMVWDYIEQNDLPYNAYYDTEMLDIPEMTKRGLKHSGFWRSLRVGCWCCTIPLKYNPHHLTHLRTFYPRLHQLLLKKGLAKFLIDEGKGTEIYRHIDPGWIAEYRPCYFDGVTV